MRVGGLPASAGRAMRTYGDRCGIARALDIVGERWALLVVRELLLGPKRFTDLRAGLPNVGPDVLAQRLRDLEGDRIAFLTGPGSRKARNLDRDPRLAISITRQDQPYQMAQVRGRVAERLEGDAAWKVIDRISHKYIGQPYPMRTDRVVFLVEPERAWGQTFG